MTGFGGTQSGIGTGRGTVIGDRDRDKQGQTGTNGDTAPGKGDCVQHHDNHGDIPKPREPGQAGSIPGPENTETGTNWDTARDKGNRNRDQQGPQPRVRGHRDGDKSRSGTSTTRPGVLSPRRTHRNALSTK